MALERRLGTLISLPDAKLEQAMLKTIAALEMARVNLVVAYLNG